MISQIIVLMIDLFPKKLFSLSLVFQMPVPVLIPSVMGNEDKVTESIEDIKEKLPSHPFEADLLEMAEMIAEDEEKEKTLSQGGWYDFKGKKRKAHLQIFWSVKVKE